MTDFKRVTDTVFSMYFVFEDYCEGRGPIATTLDITDAEIIAEKHTELTGTKCIILETEATGYRNND